MVFDWVTWSIWGIGMVIMVVWIYVPAREFAQLLKDRKQGRHAAQKSSTPEH